MNVLLLFTLNMLAALFQYNQPAIVQKEPVNQEATAALCLGPTVSIKVFLEGPFDVATGKMTDKLRTNNGATSDGTASLIPTADPYSDAPYSTVFAHVIPGGGETITAPNKNARMAALGDNSIVDWVFVELRDAAGTTVLATQSALLQVDGDVVDVDGVSPVSFPSTRYTTLTCGGNFIMGIRHRNHLAIRTSAAVQLVSTTAAVVDFTLATTGVFGADPRQTITLTAGGTVKALYSGDTDNSNSIAAPDRANTWNDRNLSGYQKNDCSMNNTVDAADRALAWNNRNKTNL